MGAVSINIDSAFKSESGDKSIVDDFMYGSNVAQSHVYIRMGFLRKVYGILSVQLIATTIIAGLCRFTPTIRGYVNQNSWLLTVALLSSIVILLALHIYRRKTPINFILLATFTIVEAYCVACIVTFYDQLIVLQAFTSTAVIVICLTLYTLQSKRDFSTWGAGLFAALCILIMAGFLQVFLGTTVSEVLLSAAGAAVFSMFIIYDTHMIMHRLSAEEYILATITLYLDIFNLFMYLLRFLDAIKRS